MHRWLLRLANGKLQGCGKSEEKGSATVKTEAGKKNLIGSTKVSWGVLVNEKI